MTRGYIGIKFNRCRIIGWLLNHGLMEAKSLIPMFDMEGNEAGCNVEFYGPKWLVKHYERKMPHLDYPYYSPR